MQSQSLKLQLVKTKKASTGRSEWGAVDRQVEAETARPESYKERQADRLFCVSRSDVEHAETTVLMSNSEVEVASQCQT